MQGLNRVTVGIKLLNGEWILQPIYIPSDKNGVSQTPLHLDRVFIHADTSFRFKGYSRSGRILYIETNKERKHPRVH